MGLFFVDICEKIDRVITTPHCMYIWQNWSVWRNELNNPDPWSITLSFHSNFFETPVPVRDKRIFHTFLDSLRPRQTLHNLAHCACRYTVLVLRAFASEKWFIFSLRFQLTIGLVQVMNGQRAITWIDDGLEIWLKYNNQGRFHYNGFISIPTWLSNLPIVKCAMILIIHSQTSTVTSFKFWEWIRNLSTYCTVHVVTYSIWDWN